MSEVATPSLLADAFSQHIQATIQLTKVALELEWTIFTRFTVGVITATMLSIIYLVLTLRNSKRPLVVWEKLNKPLIKLFRPRIFAFLLGNMNPYSKSIGIYENLYLFSWILYRFYACIQKKRKKKGKRKEKERKKKRKKKRDTYMFPSIHATALATFAESVGELGLLSSLKDKEEITLLSLELEFKKKARGLLTASTDFTLPQDTDKDEEEVSSRKVNVQVVVKDRTLDTVAIAHLVWVVEKKSV
ncbi:hypothetical protein INT48_004875 [Thamnidium elegans]|uniref:Uncharacterized protein n=1 Tax=Thamnidium elegans TaxID=101142 RepID=A0A8H7SU77_9FUNG|nr:hypothetical protein INT48_004875 [Thamnidium elegans]